MSIPLFYYCPKLVTDTSSNGGRMINKQVSFTAGGDGNFSGISADQRANGVTKFIKVFAKIADATKPHIIRSTFFLTKPSLLTDSRSYMIKGTQRDQLGAIGTRKYATGVLHTAVTAGDTVLVVDFETGSGADLVVQAGDKIAVKEGVTENTDLYVASVVWTGDQAAITLTTNVRLDFTTAALVASCILDTANVNPSFDNIVKTFSTSTFNETTHPIQTNNLATTEQTITITMTGTTTFSCLSDEKGILATGSTLSDYAPVNADFSLPYFILPAAGWGGTGTVGETMQFQIHPAAVPIWVVQKTSAGVGMGTDEVYLSARLES